MSGSRSLDLASRTEGRSRLSGGPAPLWASRPSVCRPQRHLREVTFPQQSALSQHGSFSHRPLRPVFNDAGTEELKEGTAWPGLSPREPVVPVSPQTVDGECRGSRKEPENSGGAPARRSTEAATWGPCGLRPVKCAWGGRVAALRLSPPTSGPQTASFPS